MEGDTPDGSEYEDDLEGTSDATSSYEEEFQAVLSRRNEFGKLEYLVSYDTDTEWVDRSDVWDDGPNTAKICAYDKSYPIDWDSECQYCLSIFNGGCSGCEECRCCDCGKPTRHLQGINYGCEKHPVL